MKNKCEVCSKIFYSDGNTCNECATKMDGVDRNKYDDFEPDIKTSLTPEHIASMSEVVAKYMGWKRIPQKEIDYWRIDDFFQCFIGNECFDSDWNRIHEVWEKVSEEEYITTMSYNDSLKGSEFYETIEYTLVESTPLEAFTALYNAIAFINNLKK